MLMRFERERVAILAALDDANDASANDHETLSP
jgi:hypothetical protein